MKVALRSNSKAIAQLGMRGAVAEWSKAHAWKVCIGQPPIVGSNPTRSAINSSTERIIISEFAGLPVHGMLAPLVRDGFQTA